MVSNSRRSFIRKTTAASLGVLSSVALSSSNAFASQLLNNPNKKKKRIRIGIIGAENSHTAGYGKLFNVKKKFPGVEVKY